MSYHGGGFLHRWYNTHRSYSRNPGNYPSWNNRGSHDYSREVHRKNGYGGGVGDYRHQGGPIFKGTGASFNYSAPQTPRPSPPGQSGPNPSTSPWQTPRFANLENNLPLPQGWQREFAQPTSVSSTISNLLYQSRRDPNDVWGSIFGNNRSSNQSYSGGTSYGSYGGRSGYNNRQPNTGGGATNYNSSSSMSNSAIDALRLADAYFAPKRLELAYQLGDMETDMKRLAVNLGRQVDDPVLQAKLYKEAMKSIRTLDSDQNSFAIQMLEQRRKEEIQNRQFYDQLALEKSKMQQQDDQFYASLELQRRQVNLQSQQVNAQLS